MTRTYKSYDDEYKMNIVKLIESGKPITDISREYGLHRSVLYDWKKKFETITINEGNITNNAEVEKIIKENKKLKEENEILKKAMAIFTQR